MEFAQRMTSRTKRSGRKQAWAKLTKRVFFVTLVFYAVRSAKWVIQTSEFKRDVLCRI